MKPAKQSMFILLLSALFSSVLFKINLPNPAFVFKNSEPISLEASNHEGVAIPASLNTWQFEIVEDQQGGYSPLALKLDSLGRPHISYCKDGKLIHAYKEQSNWHFQTIDDRECGYLSMAIDYTNLWHIAYVSCRNCSEFGCDECRLNYARAYPNGSWGVGPIDSLGESPGELDLEVDSQGRPHIFYHNGSGVLKYAYQSSPGLWQIQMTGSTGRKPSIALDRSDRAHISYIYGNELKYGYKENADWQIQTIDRAYNKGFFSLSLALDQVQNPHAIYSLGFCDDFYCSDFETRYAYYKNSTWTIRTVVYEDSDPSLSIDSFGYPHFCYSVNGLKYAHLDHSGWHIQIVDVLDSYNCSLALDKLGYPHIGYIGLKKLDGNSFTPVIKYTYIPSPILSYNTYLPSVLRDFLAHFEGPWEVEPNNSELEANGPLHSGRDYYGYPNDVKDYFSVYLRRNGTISIDLAHHTGSGVQLQLFYQTTANRVAFDPDAPYHIDYTGPAGWYYIYIYTAGNYNSATPYTLRVTYPQ